MTDAGAHRTQGGLDDETRQMVVDTIRQLSKRLLIQLGDACESLLVMWQSRPNTFLGDAVVELEAAKLELDLSRDDPKPPPPPAADSMGCTACWPVWRWSAR